MLCAEENVPLRRRKYLCADENAALRRDSTNFFRSMGDLGGWVGVLVRDARAFSRSMAGRLGLKRRGEGVTRWFPQWAMVGR